MAFVVSRPSGAWELRESRATAAGPRSRTLATFSTLTGDVIERARERASRPLDEVDAQRAARRAGAPVALDPAIEAAATLLHELERGGAPPRGYSRLLRGALGDESRASDAERAAAAWIGIPAEQRGEALRDLLLLADRLPAGRRGRRLRFPRLAAER